MTELSRQQLASRLRQARRNRGLSQQEVAMKLGLPRPAISHIETGQRRVEAIELAELARIYGQSINHFTNLAVEAQFDRLVRVTGDFTDEEHDELMRYVEQLKRARCGA